MRSRYSAFKLGNLDYIDKTHASNMAEPFDHEHGKVMVNEIDWRGLEIRQVIGGGEKDETGEVEFVARFKREGQTGAHHEKATFKRENGRWVYLDGELNPKAPPRRVVQVGRNDLCPCGSGKKYKKCCGASA